MAPGPGAILFVSIPTPTGSILAALGADGTPRPGWPIAIEDSCTQLMARQDGSVRAICDTPGFEAPQDAHAYAFDLDGRPVAGWPVHLGSDVQPIGRMVGDDLVLVGGPSMQIVAPDGTVRRGNETAHECCYGWAIANDGVAYASIPVAELSYNSRMTAVGPDGELAGWPVQLDGRASTPAATPDDRIVVAVGPYADDAGRVLAFDRNGTAAAVTSSDLPIAFVRPVQGDVDCGPSWVPHAPIVGPDGTTFVYSDLDDAVLALNPFLTIRDGWPFRPATRLEDRYYVDPRHDGISCGTLARPVVGPGSNLYMPLQARDNTAGGSLVAVGRDGKVRSGWPVELRRPGSEFWSVVAGADGTVYALALEPESSNTWSSSVLAIAPDSTVVYTTTIVEP